MNRPRVLLADDHRLVREAIAQLLTSECDVVGAVGDGRAALSAARELRPDVVILDAGMPLLNGVEAARELRHVLPTAKVIILTVNEDPILASEASRAGASGYLLKKSAASELLQAIRDVCRGRTYVTPLVTPRAVDPLRHDPGSRPKAGALSARQREVLQLLSEGHTLKAAARFLNISPRTVAFHKYRMMKELRLRSSAALVRFAIERHFVAGGPGGDDAHWWPGGSDENAA